MKQYLMVCDEEGVEQFSTLLQPNKMQFLEVVGINLNNENRYHVLVTPVLNPVAMPTQDDAVAQSIQCTECEIQPVVDNA